MANPFTADCGAPGHPITVAYYPSKAQLARQNDPATSGDTQPPVTIPGGPSLAVTGMTANGTAASSKPASAHAAQTFQCILTVFAPTRGNDGGNIFMYGQSSVGSCSLGVIEAQACTDLYQRTTWVATDCDSTFGAPPPTALATAIYDCGHSNVIPYTNRGIGYMETASGQAAFNNASKGANHSCT